MRVFLLSLLLLVIPSLSSALPNTVSFQGILKDSTATLVEDEVYSIKFSIYNNQVDGSLLWQSDGFIPILTSDGLFSHPLGSTNPIPDSLSDFAELWLGITVDLDEEMPRIKVQSEIFAFKAITADTASFSRDKTIDAGELTLGTLSTERYSAFSDLVEEGRIGTGSGQLSPGNHTHSGIIKRYENTTSDIITVPNAADITLKQLNIPANEIGNYFNFTFCYHVSGGTPGGLVYFYLNGELFRGADGQTGYHRYEHYCIKLDSDTWVGYGNSTISINPENGLNLEVRANNETGGTVVITTGTLILEYDAD